MTKDEMQNVLSQYIAAWQQQDSDALVRLFADDGIYRVKPFGAEEYHGTQQIREYWDAHPVAMQVDPAPKILTAAFGGNLCFAEWQNTFTTHQGVKKTTLGMLLLIFDSDGRIQELREHFTSMAA